MTTAILLISEQTLPNVLFLKQFGPFDRHVFLTTDKMEAQRRSDWIIQATGIDPESVKRLRIDPENATVGLNKLEQQDWPTNTEYLINITGGTKMMALAAYTFFAGKSQCRIIYLPINAPHFLELAPQPRELALLAKVSLDEYLKAYGIVVQQNQTHWEFLIQQAEEVMKAIQGQGEPQRVKDILAWTQFQNQNELSPEKRSFYTGGWLEVWIAAQVQKFWRVSSADILVGVLLNREGLQRNASYEYDVLFVKNNYMYLCECKYFNGRKFAKEKINKELFKFASAYAQLGLFAKPFFAIANDISGSEALVRESCQLLRLPYPATLNILTDPQSFESFIEKL